MSPHCMRDGGVVAEYLRDRGASAFQASEVVVSVQWF